MAKKITKKLKLVVQGGAATPAGKTGPALGQAGVNIGEFAAKRKVTPHGWNVDKLPQQNLWGDSGSGSRPKL